MTNFDFQSFRQYFPFFGYDPKTVYLDNAATTLKPQCLVNATCEFYQSAGSVHRAQYDAKQTALYEQARLRVKNFLNAESEQAVIWTSGTTQAINTVANGLLPQLQAGDEIIISQAEHHANYVTWSEVAQKSGATLHVLPINDHFLIEQKTLCDALTPHTKVVAINFASNVTGTVQPVADLIKLVRQHSRALICVDAAQAVSHYKIDVQALDADFLAFSAHKLFGPTGLGLLTGKLSSLEKLQPLQYGGKMVDVVSPEKITFSSLPYRLEAGTPNIAGVIGFNAVLEWLAQYDLQELEQHSVSLAEQTKKFLQNDPHLRLFNSPQPSSVVCFVLDDIPTSDLATLLSEQHIALRSGQHCAQPYLQRLNQHATLRLSFAPYNSPDDVNAFCYAFQKSIELLR